MVVFVAEEQNHLQPHEWRNLWPCWIAWGTPIPLRVLAPSFGLAKIPLPENMAEIMKGSLACDSTTPSSEWSFHPISRWPGCERLGFAFKILQGHRLSIRSIRCRINSKEDLWRSVDKAKDKSLEAKALLMSSQGSAQKPLDRRFTFLGTDCLCLSEILSSCSSSSPESTRSPPLGFHLLFKLSQ